MPPRLPATGRTSQLVHCLETTPLVLQHTVAGAGAGRPSWSPPAPQHRSAPRQQASCFSTTTPLELTKVQRKFRSWLKSAEARELHDPPEDGQPRYLGRDRTQKQDMPFLLNPAFRSQPVLSEEARETIWHSIMRKGLPLKAVSAELNVDMRRLAAVVRMKEIEKRWEADGTPMAKPYARAVMAMLPKANLSEREPPFEPINDIHVSSYTQQQLFVPTPESRHFTRRDAAKAFGDRILAPEFKLRIPEMLQFEKDVAEGLKPEVARERFVKATRRNEKVLAENIAKRLQLKESRTTKVSNGRFEFRIENVNVDWSGKHGRDRGGVGWRYGAPFNDRRRGVVKIPTKVE